MFGISASNLQTGAEIAVKAVGWINTYIDQRNKEKEHKKSNTYHDVFDEFLTVLNKFRYHSSSNIDALIPKALYGSMVEAKFTTEEAPPESYSEDFGTSGIAEMLKAATSGIREWHENRKLRFARQGNQGDLKDSAAWTIYETLRRLANNPTLLKSKQALQILSAVRFIANKWSLSTSQIGNTGLLGGEDSLKVPLMDISKNLKPIEDEIVHAVTKTGGTHYVTQLKDQQDSIYHEIRRAMLKGVTDCEVKGAIAYGRFDSKDWGQLHGSYLQAVILRIFRGPLTTAEEALLAGKQPSNEMQERINFLKFIDVLQKSTNRSDKDPTLTFISNLAKVKFNADKAHYDYDNKKYILPSGVAKTLISDASSREKAFKQFNALALHAVALKETIALQEQMVELGIQYGNMGIYGAWKALFVLLPLVSNALGKINAAMTELLESAQAERITKIFKSMLSSDVSKRRTINIDGLNNLAGNLIAIENRCKELAADLQEGLAHYYDNNESTSTTTEMSAAAANMANALLQRVKKLDHLYGSMGVKSNNSILTLLGEALGIREVEEKKAEEKASHPAELARTSVPIDPTRSLASLKLTVQTILMDGVLGQLVTEQKAGVKPEAMNLQKWTKGGSSALLSYKNIWDTSTFGNSFSKEPLKMLAFLTDRTNITRIKDGLYILRHGARQADELSQNSAPTTINRNSLNYQMVTDVDAQATLLLLGVLHYILLENDPLCPKLKAWRAAIATMTASLPLPLLQKIKPDVDEIMKDLQFMPIPWDTNQAYREEEQQQEIARAEQARVEQVQAEQAQAEQARSAFQLAKATIERNENRLLTQSIGEFMLTHDQENAEFQENAIEDAINEMLMALPAEDINSWELGKTLNGCLEKADAKAMEGIDTELRTKLLKYSKDKLIKRLAKESKLWLKDFLPHALVPAETYLNELLDGQRIYKNWLETGYISIATLTVRLKAIFYLFSKIDDRITTAVTDDKFSTKHSEATQIFLEEVLNKITDYLEMMGLGPLKGSTLYAKCRLAIPHVRVAQYSTDSTHELKNTWIDPIARQLQEVKDMLTGMQATNNLSRIMDGGVSAKIEGFKEKLDTLINEGFVFQLTRSGFASLQLQITVATDNVFKGADDIKTELGKLIELLKDEIAIAGVKPEEYKIKPNVKNQAIDLTATKPNILNKIGDILVKAGEKYFQSVPQAKALLFNFEAASSSTTSSTSSAPPMAPPRKPLAVTCIVQ